MKTRVETKANEPIRLNETFSRLASGAVSFNQIVQERLERRTLKLMTADDYTRRHLLAAEVADPFTANYCR